LEQLIVARKCCGVLAEAPGFMIKLQTKDGGVNKYVELDALRRGASDKFRIRSQR
jgi:hypothetical protein